MARQHVYFCLLVLALAGCAGGPQYADTRNLGSLAPKIGVFAVEGLTEAQFNFQYELSADDWSAMRGLSTAALTASPGTFLVWDKPGSLDPKGHPILMVQVLAEIPASGGCRSVEWLFSHDLLDDQADLKALLHALNGTNAGPSWMAKLAKQYGSRGGRWDIANMITVCPTERGGSVYAYNHVMDYYSRTDPSVWVHVGDFKADPDWAAAATKAGDLIVKPAPVPPPGLWSGPVPEPAAHKTARLAAAGGAAS